MKTRGSIKKLKILLPFIILFVIPLTLNVFGSFKTENHTSVFISPENSNLFSSDSEMNGSEYLIITHENFSDTIKILAEDKIKHGISTKIVNSSSICENPTPENISDYIQNAYDTWNPKPKYILLVGDVEYIPAHTGAVYDVSTDLYYATVNGSDYFPDLYVGRFPVKTNEELEIIINKTINYEENYDPSKAMFSDVLLAAYDQYGRYYINTSESIREFLENNSYTTTCVYTGGDYTGTTEDIINCINQGALLLNHRDHGGVNGWSYPSFTISDIDDLNNSHFQPVMFSINCLSGSFDYPSDCFGEAILKTENKGISAFIGASTVSYSGYNDELNKGLFASIWPDYYPNYSNGNVTRTTELGGILNFGKMFMYDKYYLTNGEGYIWSASESTTRLQFEIMNLLGDPELSVIDNKAPEIHNLSLNSDNLFYGETQKLSFNVREKFALDSINITIDNDSYLLTNLTEEFYEFSFQPNKIGKIIYKIEINDTSGNTVNFTGDFIVNPQPMNIETSKTLLNILGNSYFLLDINLTGSISGLLSGPANISTDWSKDYNVINHNNGTFTLDFSTADLPESGITESYTIEIYANKTNYISTSKSLKISINPIQTLVNLNISILKVYINQTFNLKVNFTEEVSGQLISNANCSVNWLKNANITRVSSGFIISFSTLGLEKGNYTAVITLDKPGYETSFNNINIIIEESPPNLRIDLVFVPTILIGVAGVSIVIIKKLY
ncbi:MAG: C25 family cysteine peptidase [Promethearchaeati archaeon]